MNRPGVLFLTNPEDFHALAVGIALRRRGVHVWEWHTSDFPSLQRASIWTSADTLHLQMDGPDLSIADIEPVSIWVRRPTRPVPSDCVAPQDYEFALRESKIFSGCLFQMVGRHAFWVKSLASATRAEMKTEQLRAAVKAGFKIPETLCSNDPDRIRRFIRERKGAVIYKSFYPVSWGTSDGIAVLFSSEVSEEDLPADALLQAVPGIYQAKVPKKYELRITIMGDCLIAARLSSQAIQSAQIDWRAAEERVPLEPAEISSALQEACRKVMKDLEIVFGCFDLIVTPQGEVIFLEVNQAGSFLWIEEQNPEFMFLNTFCEFLVHGTQSFRGAQSNCSVRLDDVKAEALLRMREAPSVHLAKEPETLND